MPNLPPNIVMDQTPHYASLDIEEMVRLNAAGLSAPELTKKLLRTNNEVALDRFITADPAMLAMKSMVESIILLPFNNLSPVLITGPSGTGKEIIAHAFHRRSTSFIARNCAGFPKDIILSLLFGHQKGTFTGAIDDRIGLFEAASNIDKDDPTSNSKPGGTVFLDEIGDLPLEAQAMLLRVLQERTIVRLGAIKETPINCRVIGATKYDLRERVNQHLFREDLFARLMTFEIKLTGLKERPEDIPLIAKDGYDMNGQPLNYTAPITNGTALEDIFTYNVRAIQTFVARMRTYGSY